MKNIVYVSDTNSMGKMKFKWLSYIIETLYPDAKLSHHFTPSEVFGIPDEEYKITYEKSKEEGVYNGVSNESWDTKAINPDAIIIDDLTRANPGMSGKVYNRSRILYEAIKRNVQVHMIAPDVTMSYGGGLEINNKTKLPFSEFKDFSNVHIWYGVNNLEDYKSVGMWKQNWVKMPNSVPHRNLITAVCYAYLKKHEKQIKESLSGSVAYTGEQFNSYVYYGYWRRGMLLDNVINSGVDIVIGSFKWRPHCESHDIAWMNGNKTLEEIFSQTTKSYIPYEGQKNDIQHIFRQFEGLAYARDGVVYDDKYPEHMRVYSLDDPKLKELYGPILSEFVQLLKEA